MCGVDGRVFGVNHGEQVPHVDGRVPLPHGPVLSGHALLLRRFLLCMQSKYPLRGLAMTALTHLCQ